MIKTTSNPNTNTSTANRSSSPGPTASALAALTPQHLPATDTDTAAALGGPIAHSRQLAAEGRLVEARDVLNTALTRQDSAPTPGEAKQIRNHLTQINNTLIFSPRVIADDPLTETHTIQHGEFLSGIAPQYDITYQLIERINGVTARRIRLGQRIKVIKGPFHAVVHKSDYRMDVFLADSGGQPVYIRSFDVALGEDNSTPVGAWRVRTSGKVSNPGWTNPRTGKVYAPNDSQNPIGEFWIGLEGADDHTRGLAGYGVHGTIDSESIGQQVSMGCVRLRPDDIALVYELLIGGRSTVVVQP